MNYQLNSSQKYELVTGSGKVLFCTDTVAIIFHLKTFELLHHGPVKQIREINKRYQTARGIDLKPEDIAYIDGRFNIDDLNLIVHYPLYAKEYLQSLLYRMNSLVAK